LDFARVFDDVASFLEAHGHPVAVVGGLALLGHGLTRTTFDLDVHLLLGLPGVDREEARGYSVRAGMGERFDELIRSL